MIAVRILVTGSREWTDRPTAFRALLDAVTDLCPSGGRLADVTVVHGAARGLDTIAAEQARLIGLQSEPHPADWAAFGRSAGHRRNAEMVAAGADICLAFPLGESRGTRGCMELARKAGIPVREVTPNPNGEAHAR